MATVLLIDASPLIYSNYAKLSHLATSTGESTGMRYGFIRSVRSYATKTKADKVVICFDLPGQVIKATGHVTYKADRVVTPEKEKMWAQVPALREMLRLTRYTQIDSTGYEADDVIGHLARRLEKDLHQVLIASSDNDLCQLITPNIKIWMPPKDREKEWFKDDQWVREQFGVPANHLLTFRAITGDASDNLKGLGLTRGQEVVIASKLATEPPMTPEEALKKLVAYGYIHSSEGAEGLFHENVRVMRLWDPETLNIIKGEASNEKLTALFDRLQMKSLSKTVSDFTGKLDSGKLADLEGRLNAG